MNADDRRRVIEERVMRLGEVSLNGLTAEFGVSEMTIRRDLDLLAGEGVLRKVMGGAISLVGKSTEPSFRARASVAAAQKIHLARLAVTLLKPHQTVVLDSGSTVLAIAREIRGMDLGLTIVTPSLPAAIELAEEPGTTVILTGGTLRSGELSLIGSDAEDAFLRYNCDVYLMGIAGLDGQRGASDYHRDEGAVKRYAARASDTVIAVVDQSKLGRVQLLNVALPSEIDAVVTDAAPDHPVLQQLAQAGVAIHCTALPESDR
ncbi:MAG: DeoR/GlpR family DNA-binding transcription regulator [Beutenbergiaceae bacterium]